MEAISDFQTYIHAEIPLTKEMGIRILATQPQVILEMPLFNNRNNKNTAFAGSLSAGFSIGGWIMAQNLLQTESKLTDQLSNFEVSIVLKENKCRFLKPITGNFKISVERPKLDAQLKYYSNLSLGKMASILVTASAILEQPLVGQPLVGATFEGLYVAIPYQT